MTHDKVRRFPELIQRKGENLPSSLHLFVEKEIEKDLPTPTIIDFIQLGQIEQIFIPIIPKALHEYNLSPSPSLKE